MIRIAKRDGNRIERMRFETEEDYKNGKWCYLGGDNIHDVDLDKSYINELYCRNICRNYYCFGTDWDRRCNENDEPIQIAVTTCPKFENGLKLAKELKEKMESDKDFMEYCKIVNTNMKHKGESKLEIFLAVFKKYI